MVLGVAQHDAASRLRHPAGDALPHLDRRIFPRHSAIFFAVGALQVNDLQPGTVLVHQQHATLVLGYQGRNRCADAIADVLDAGGAGKLLPEGLHRLHVLGPPTRT